MFTVEARFDTVIILKPELFEKVQIGHFPLLVDASHEALKRKAADMPVKGRFSTQLTVEKSKLSEAENANVNLSV